jgi:Domain of unknown function (DUF1963)
MEMGCERSMESNLESSLEVGSWMQTHADRWEQEFGRADLRELAVDSGLGAAADEFARIARWGMRLEPLDARPETGSSKIGGYPDLPPDLEWPASGGNRSLFLAQLAIDEFPSDAFGLPWPARDATLLSFFAFQHHHTQEVVDGRVLAVAPGQAPERVRPSALSQGIVHDERAVGPRLVLTLPTWRAVRRGAIRESRLREEHQEAYAQLVSAVEEAQGIAAPRHCVLGHPDRVPDDVLQEAALINEWAGESQESPPEELEARARNWRLLLRLDSEAGRGVQWPGGGTAYFCLPSYSLDEGRFEFARAFTRAPRQA